MLFIHIYRMRFTVLPNPSIDKNALYLGIIMIRKQYRYDSIGVKKVLKILKYIFANIIIAAYNNNDDEFYR